MLLCLAPARVSGTAWQWLISWTTWHGTARETIPIPPASARCKGAPPDVWLCDSRFWRLQCSHCLSDLLFLVLLCVGHVLLQLGFIHRHSVPNEINHLKMVKISSCWQAYQPCVNPWRSSRSGLLCDFHSQGFCRKGWRLMASTAFFLHFLDCCTHHHTKESRTSLKFLGAQSNRSESINCCYATSCPCHG